MGPRHDDPRAGTGVVETAVGRFHELLGHDHYARLAHDRLLKHQHDANMTPDGRPLTHMLRPRFMSEAEHSQGCADGALLARAIHRLAAYALRPGEAGDLVRRQLALSDEEKALFAMAPATGVPGSHSRLDGFRAAGRTLFVEYNSHSPAGIISQDLLADAYLDTPVMEAFTREYTVRPVPGLRRMADTLVGAWAAGGSPGGAPRAAIVDWKPKLRWEFDALQAQLRRHGVPAVVCTPDDLHYDSGRGLFTRDADGRPRPVTVVHRRAVLTDLLSHYGHAFAEHPMTRAWVSGACVMVNPYTSNLANKKSALALLTDPCTRCLLPAPEAVAAGALVPWTRLVRPGPTVCPDGRVVDLLDFARARREHLVLKPNDDYGGNGVVCGWLTPDAAWRTALGRALTTPHVVQERVPIPAVPYPVLDGGRLRVERSCESTDPFLFGADAPGCISRVSTAALINVSTGGCPVPVFRITPR
ncbi:hypothetical protein [Streptomyces sp. UNOB3_S3]|uniref:hypothetical protein n=1 Tax=Streptomyces sp. UNOB3_S3 TaxID=2871682 RepID=UPI001E370F6B|nr:hypothetical protein [Streptomyces sp. UNOB3_S3]MCC3777967.1 hypothetical protein [Streptomyces sp. UNOB3_S3]